MKHDRQRGHTSLLHRRVEDSMMPLIRTALRQSSAQTRKARREEAAQETLKQDKQANRGRRRSGRPEKSQDPPPAANADEMTKPLNVTKDFQALSTSAPRRLNDIAQEPPVIKKVPRGVTKNDAAPPGGLSMAQKAMMEEERERVIRHYRDLKARKRRDGGGLRLDG